MARTSAMRFLGQRDVPYEVREYDMKVKGAEFAASALGWPLEAMFKTLVVELSDGRPVLVCMPGNLELSLKKLSRWTEVKNAKLASTERAERLTGYKVGGISPFGTRESLEVWMHESARNLERVALNGGRRGTILILRAADAIETCQAHLADLAAA